jgi:hypothetical protein
METVRTISKLTALGMLRNKIIENGMSVHKQSGLNIGNVVSVYKAQIFVL